MTLPYRPVYYGETITVTIVAANPTPTPLSRFSVPLRWNSNVLTYVSASAGPLWSAIQVADPPLAQVVVGQGGSGVVRSGCAVPGISWAPTGNDTVCLLVCITLVQLPC